MPRLPTGSITLLFTDIEGSTRLLQQLGKRYAAVFRDCRRLLRAAFQQWNGFEVDTQGDSFFVVFERAIDAVRAAANAQRALFSTQWPEGSVVRVRMGLHTGEPQPTDEGYIGLDVHCAARIMSAAHGGQVLLSRATCDLIVADMPDDVQLRNLGNYRLKDIAGPNQLFQLVIPEIPADFPPLAAASSRRPLQNLPSPATSFVGREADVAAISKLLCRTDVRMVTLMGTAGVGKTRLALQVAAKLSPSFKDGVCFVSLEQVDDAGAFQQALAQALNVQEEKERSLFEQVKAALREQTLLLILDNFEQVLPAGVEVAALLTACPKIKALVTSRAMLHIQAEHLFEVLPLPLLDPRLLPDLAALSDNAAIALFVQRAQAVQPDFQLTAANATTIAGICERLDGIPLALELAAARVRHFTPPTLLARLERGSALLQRETRDVPARQQTLRGAIAWSYELLEPVERQVFRRLAVCVNGATLEAAERICSSEAEEEDISTILDALVDKSMLLRRGREDQQPRYRQLQTLREYGMEQLSASAELESTRAAHAAYYLSWAEQVAPLLSGAEQVSWLDCLEQEYDNMRAALEWFLEDGVGRAEQALRLCIALQSFWEMRGYMGEGLALLERALNEREHVSPPIQMQALHGAASLALMQDDRARAADLLRECQILFRASGDRTGMANILRLQGKLALAANSYNLARRLLNEALAIYLEEGDTAKIPATREALAQIATAQGDYATAQSLLNKTISAFQARGDNYRVAYSQYLLARLLFLFQMDHAGARALAEESLSLFKAIGDKSLIAYTCSLLGQIALFEKHERDAMVAMVEESIAILKSMRDRSGAAEALIALARIKADLHENDAAKRCYEESWQLLQETGAKDLEAACLEGYGEVLTALGMPEVAVTFWGTAATVRADIAAPLPPVYQNSYHQAIARAREVLGEAGFQDAWAKGHMLPLEQIVIANPTEQGKERSEQT
jgi:predicted ATPase/class 3 adenylate cyclase